jgi:ketosteroid isomerase-like protein
MTQSKLDTVRTYYGASALRDYETAGACVGSGYVSIDRHKGVIYRTIDELLEAQAEDAAWSDRTFDITNAMETTDDALVVQVTIAARLNGTWGSLTGRGESVSFDACVIFRFDDEGRIISEEQYSDLLTVKRQLDASDE